MPIVRDPLGDLPPNDPIKWSISVAVIPLGKYVDNKGAYTPDEEEKAELRKVSDYLNTRHIDPITLFMDNPYRVVVPSEAISDVAARQGIPESRVDEYAFMLEAFAEGRQIPLETVGSINEFLLSLTETIKDKETFYEALKRRLERHDKLPGYWEFAAR